MCIHFSKVVAVSKGTNIFILENAWQRDMHRAETVLADWKKWQAINYQYP